MTELPFNIGVHPINWVGEDVLEHGDYYSYDQVMEEIAALGFKGTEVSRKFPNNEKELKNALDHYNLQLTTQWKSVLFSDPDQHEKEWKSYREHVDFLKRFGCKVVSTAEIGGSMLNQDPRRGQDETYVERLDDDGWKYLAEGLNKAGEICRETGMHLVYHHHAGTVVEQPEEIDRLMEMTDKDAVSLLYDTGHGYYGGNDPLQLLKKHFDRIKYIHLKDVRQDILDRARQEKYSIRQCIREGIFTVPGEGCLDFAPIITYLIENDYSGWALIEGEQDPEIYNPYEYAKRSKAFLEKLAGVYLQR
ncbi:myo-inosose-2 dehydratase [Alteribacillus sp. YIM 98480]|uniref:myo-inosose-2 dehydratase n=1 Tax=Alteribacillus sp. YIM 98480 TaxID=2606599 RepID=UPI00131C07E9|nr:myo-inosose-2 dehydratase [Alteribacillus sp. YIM 98480]